MIYTHKLVDQRMQMQATLCLVLVFSTCPALSFFTPLKSRHSLLTSSSSLNNNNLNKPYNDIDNIRTPFLSELIQTSRSIPLNNRFFFPGHVGGRNFPLSKLLASRFGRTTADGVNHMQTHDFNLMLQLDLPELESIDSVHCPEVRFDDIHTSIIRWYRDFRF